MRKRKTTKEAEAKAEMIYWATGRTKIYPEKNLAKNYNEVGARSEKKREREDVSTRSKSNLKG
jgi:hypothetical protein